MDKDEIIRMARDEDEYLTKSKVIVFNEPNFVCPKHGEIGNATLCSTLKGLEMRLCLHCYIEKMLEIGVCQVKENNK